MNNLEIRLLVAKNKLKYKDIADEMNISREWLSRLMRKPLSTENKIRILRAIEELTKGAKADDIQ